MRNRQRKLRRLLCIIVFALLLSACASSLSLEPYTFAAQGSVNASEPSSDFTTTTELVVVSLPGDSPDEVPLIRELKAAGFNDTEILCMYEGVGATLGYDILDVDPIPVEIKMELSQILSNCRAG